jgi:hypothetical protein
MTTKSTRYSSRSGVEITRLARKYWIFGLSGMCLDAMCIKLGRTEDRGQKRDACYDFYDFCDFCVFDELLKAVTGGSDALCLGAPPVPQGSHLLNTDKDDLPGTFRINQIF